MWELLPPELKHLKQPRTYCFSKCSSPNHLWIILILTSLAVQHLRHTAPSAEGTGSIPGQGSRIPHATQCGKKKKEKIKKLNKIKIKKDSLVTELKAARLWPSPRVCSLLSGASTVPWELGARSSWVCAPPVWTFLDALGCYSLPHSMGPALPHTHQIHEHSGCL